MQAILINKDDSGYRAQMSQIEELIDVAMLSSDVEPASCSERRRQDRRCLFEDRPRGLRGPPGAVQGAARAPCGRDA